MRRASWLILALLVLTSQAPAATTCPADTSNTVPTVEGVGLPKDFICFGCREQNRFWQDAHNAVWNYVQFGAGAFTYNYYFESLDRFGGQSQMPVRVVNGLGQSVTVTVVTNFNTLFSIGAYGVSVAMRTSIQSYQLMSWQSSGASKVTIYTKSDAPTSKLAIPGTPTDDGYTPGVHCLNNNGTQRVTIVSSPPTSGPRPGGGTITATPISGGTGSEGGIPTHTRECWRIVTRDGTGKLIGDSIQCVIVS